MMKMKRMRKMSLRKMTKRRTTMRMTTTLSDFLGRVICSCPFLLA
jgi:hypothetical protein